MNESDKLYFELGAKDNVTPIIEKLLKDSKELQDNFDNFKAITIKDIMLKTDSALGTLRKQIQDGLDSKPFNISVEASPDVDVSKITDAVRTIVEAQERLIKGASVEVGASVGNTSGHNQQNTQAARDNAEATQQQARSYEELKAQVDAVLGSIQQNTATIVEQRNAISLIDKEIKAINKDVEKSGAMSDAQRKRLEMLTASREQHKQTLQSSMRILQNDIKLGQAATGSMDELSQSLGRMRKAYRAMTEEERNGNFGKELLASIQTADAKIKELDASIGNHQRNVGNYGSAFNGLNMSVQQVVRELPSATMGLQMFFLAISNNLPILADQIKMAKEANKAMKDMGQETTPVWKQLIKSLFSWQTAMVVGITLVTLYGKEIAEWAKQLFTGQRAAISAKDATEKLNEALEKNDNRFSDNAISVKRLASEWKDLKNEAEKTAWIEANQSAFDAMGLSIRDVTSAERAFVEYTPAVVEALKSRARAEAARELAKEKYKEAFLKREKARQEKENGVSWTDRMAGNMAQISTTGTGNFSATQPGASANDIAKGRHEQRVKSLNDEADTLEKEIEVYYDIAKLEDEKSKAELKRLGIYKEQGKTAKEQLQAQKANLQAQLDILLETEAAGKKGEELRNKIAAIDKRLSVYSNTKKDKSDREDARAAARAEREAIKAGEAAEKRAGILTRQGIEIQRQEIDTELTTRQAVISAMEESTEKTLKQIRLDKDKKLEAIRREYEDIKLKRIEEAKKLWDADPKNKGVNFYESETYKTAASDSQYSKKQKDNRIERERQVVADYIKGIRKVSDEETKAMLEYLKTFGSVEQMRLAIRKDYDRRIAKEDDEWRRKSLEKERDAAIDKVKAENLLKDIDLASVFSQYGVILASPLEETLKQLKEYVKTDNFKARSFQDQKTIYDTIHNVESQLGGVAGVSWNVIGQNIYEYNNALVAYRVASENLAKAAQESLNAREEVNRADEALAKAETDEARAAAQKARNRLASANQNYSKQQENFDSAQNRVIASQTAASEHLRKLQDSIDNVGKIASAVASGSMRQLWDALGAKTQKRIGQFISGTKAYSDAVALASSVLSKQGRGMDYLVERISGLATEIYESGDKIESAGIGDKITALFDELFGDSSSKMKVLGDDLTKILNKVLSDGKKNGEDTGEAVKKAATEAVAAISKTGGSLWVMIVGLVLDLLDVLAEGIGALVESILDNVGEAIEGILTEIGSGKFFERILTGIGNVIGGIIKGIGNLFSGGTAFGGGNADDMEKEIAKLAQANEALGKSIESLSKSIKDNDSTNKQSEEAYRRALSAEKEWEQNQRQAIKNRASEWSNSGHGFMGLAGKSSFNYFLNHSGIDWNAFNKVLEQNGYKNRVYSAGDLWNLSPEMMQLLRDYAPKAWADLLNTDGEANPSELLDEYIERAGKIDELTSALNEKLTGYSWDSFKGSYVDTLKDLTSTTENFADNIEDLLTQAILNSLVNEAYKDRIQKLYKMIADAAGEDSEGGTSFTSNELQAIRDYNEQLANDLIAAREALVQSGAIKETSGSSSMSGSIKGVTEQTADLLASYINSIRATTAINQDALMQIVHNTQQMSPIIQSQLEQLRQIVRSNNQIAENTQRNVQLVERIENILHSSQTGARRLEVKLYGGM